MMSEQTLTPIYSTLDEWIAHEAIPFSIDSPTTFDAAVDKLIAAIGDSVELLGFGEALHGGEEILLLRNHLFQRLVEKHGYSAIAIESSFPRSHIVNEYVAGRGSSYEAIAESGFSYGFRGLEANRELVGWMRQYNADAAHPVKLRFYGFDSPTAMVNTDSPRQLLHFVLDYLASMDSARSQKYRARIDPLLGEDAAWENPAAMMDPTQSIGLSPAAIALRIETENLIAELRVRRPELVGKSGAERYGEATQYASLARQMLNYHAGLAGNSSNRTADLLGLRDAMMADNLEYMVARERGRGKVLVFAHNNHVQRGQTQWQLGPDLLTWWPVGAQLNAIFGARYVAIGSAVSVSEENGIGQPETGTLETLLAASPGPGRLIATYKGQGLPASAVAALPTRSGSTKNFSYFALTPQSLTNFDWLLLLDTITYHRGGPPLP